MAAKQLLLLIKERVLCYKTAQRLEITRKLMASVIEVLPQVIALNINIKYADY